MNHLTAVSIAPLHSRPSTDSEQINQLLFGEPFQAIAHDGLWTQGVSTLDDYKGYVLSTSLLPPPPSWPTHRVKAIQTYAYAAASIKAPTVQPLWRGSLLRAIGVRDTFTILADQSFVPSLDLAEANAFETDWTAAATDMLGAPYLWGGRSRLGVDCSGLVQIAMQACGIKCPRDTGDQKALGDSVEARDLQRGDLVFFPGHVGIMTDKTRLLHANAHHMRTVIEPLADVVVRLRETIDDPITAIRRIGTDHSFFREAR